MATDEFRRQAHLSEMRWAGQRIDAIEPGALPGLARLSNLVRSVRTPEFEGVTFHEVLTKSALNRVPETSSVMPGGWTINPYRGCTHACVYCYARPTHEHLGLNAGADFDNQLIVKVNVAEVLQRELVNKKNLPDRVALGTNTDPYQRAEGRYQLMPPIIDALAEARIPFSILTKGAVIRRDLDRLARARERAGVELGMSIAFLDDDLQQSLEPGVSLTSARLTTLRNMRDAGFAPTVFLAPLLPHLTDSTETIDRMVGILAEAGAASILPYALYLTPAVKGIFFGWLQRERPDLVSAYSALYADGSRTPQSYRNLVRARVNQAARSHGLPVPSSAISEKFSLSTNRRPDEVSSQPTLF